MAQKQQEAIHHMNTNRDYIANLLHKYWECETTLSEEQELRRLFGSDQLPEEFMQYKPLFTYFSEEQAPRLSESFNRTLEETFKQTAAKERHRSPQLSFIMQIAASLILVGGLGISVFFITRQQNHPQYSERNMEASQAIEHATHALEKLSDAITLSEEASINTLRQINEMEIDWMLIDSLSQEQALDTDTILSDSLNNELLNDVHSFNFIGDPNQTKEQPILREKSKIEVKI